MSNNYQHHPQHVSFNAPSPSAGYGQLRSRPEAVPWVSDCPSTMKYYPPQAGGQLPHSLPLPTSSLPFMHQIAQHPSSFSVLSSHIASSSTQSVNMHNMMNQGPLPTPPPLTTASYTHTLSSLSSNSFPPSSSLPLPTPMLPSHTPTMSISDHLKRLLSDRDDDSSLPRKLPHLMPQEPDIIRSTSTTNYLAAPPPPPFSHIPQQVTLPFTPDVSTAHVHPHPHPHSHPRPHPPSHPLTSASEVPPMLPPSNHPSAPPSQPPPTQGKIIILNEELLTMRQAAAARRLGMSSSALSKRWREAMKGRKWPYRIHCKLEKEIKELMAQHKGPNRPSDVERKLCMLIEQRNENIEPAMIRL
jgi:transposase-like protein